MSKIEDKNTIKVLLNEIAQYRMNTLRANFHLLITVGMLIFAWLRLFTLISLIPIIVNIVLYLWFQFNNHAFTININESDKIESGISFQQATNKKQERILKMMIIVNVIILFTIIIEMLKRGLV